MLLSWSCCYYCCFFCKQKTAYEMRISDWSSDVCSSDLVQNLEGVRAIERDGWVWLHPALGSRWPGRVAAVGSVTITASVGYAEGAAPDDVKQATRMIVDHWYSERDFSSTAANVDFLIDHYRFRMV